MFVRPFLLVSTLLIISDQSYAGKIEKAFERLKVYDYFAAKELFEKSYKKETGAASFGLAVIFSEFRNPFYNPDSARKYIVIADSVLLTLKDKKRQHYNRLGITDSAVESLSNFICEDAFTLAEKADSIESYNHYLLNYKNCSEFSEAELLRNAAAFNRARQINTSSSYKEFMDLYPDARQYKEAESKYEERIYYENTNNKSIAAYAFFIQNYPESPYRQQAEKMIYALSVPNKTVKQYVAFIREFDTSPFVADAWHEIYRLSMKDFSEESFSKFKRDYPDYPFPEELESDFMIQNYTFLPFESDDRWGYINEHGAEMIKPTYDDVYLFSDGLAAVSKDQKYGYINKSGKVIIDFRFNDAESFRNGAAIVLKDSLYGAINRDGEYLINPEYEELSEAGDGIYLAFKNDLSGYISRNGKQLTDFTYDVAGEFKNGYAIVSKDEKYGLINMSGYFNIEPVYESLILIGDGLFKALNEEDNWGVVNVQGQALTPFVYDAIGEFSEGRALVAAKNKCGYIKEDGSLIIPMNYKYSSHLLTTGKFQNGYALLKQSIKSTLIDTTGKTLLFPGYEDYGRPSENLIPVRKNRKWGFIDMSGKLRIPCKFEATGTFKNGIAYFRQGNMTGLIDSTGSIFIQPLYDEIDWSENHILVRYKGKSGLLSPSGILIIPCQYDKIDFITPMIARATHDQGYSYVNLKNGKIVYNSIRK